jgi:molybdopterin-biosynthesis enzyme MoeA-like protein
LVLENSLGTANAFSMPIVWDGRHLFVVVLPGPPAEVAAVWETHLASKIESLVPDDDHEDLYLWQTLGPGESDVAEKVEEAIGGSGLRVGYRVHIPYVEVKLWVRRRDVELVKPVLERVDQALAPWTVSRGQSDAADALIRASFEGGLHVVIVDDVTGGYVQSRLTERVAALRKANPRAGANGSLRVTTTVLAASETQESADTQESAETHASVVARESAQARSAKTLQLTLTTDHGQRQWLVKMTGAVSQILAIAPTSLYNFETERGLKYMAEKMFVQVGRWL